MGASIWGQEFLLLRWCGREMMLREGFHARFACGAENAEGSLLFVSACSAALREKWGRLQGGALEGSRLDKFFRKKWAGVER